ncbi:MAG: hypothetical protein ABI597_01755 [Gammaproteobacteria bacterium]
MRSTKKAKHYHPHADSLYNRSSTPHIMVMLDATTPGKMEPAPLDANTSKPTIQQKPKKQNTHFTFSPWHIPYSIDVPSAAELRESHKFHRLAALFDMGGKCYRQLEQIRSLVNNKIQDNIELGKKNGILNPNLDLKSMSWADQQAYALEVEDKLVTTNPQLRP